MRYYELQQADVGKPFIHAFGRLWTVTDFLGRVFPSDVGKRVYLRSGILQVENAVQRLSRTKQAR